MSTQSSLPIVWNEDTSEKAYLEVDQPTYTQLSVNSNYENKRKSSHIILSIFLSMITVTSFFLYAFSSEQRLLSGEKILSYLSNDFLGIDLSDNDKNIFELLMSESFGNTDLNSNEKDNTTDKADTENTPGNNEENGTATDVPDHNDIPKGEYPIIETDLSCDQIQISNKTDYEIDIDTYVNSTGNDDGYKLTINEDMTLDPIVLIIHTHGTEAFSDPQINTYSDNINIPRSEDTKENIVAVGREMASILNENGVPTIHCQIMHDKESYKNSYQRAEQTILTYTKKYPSIKYVFDVHRDSIIDDKNSKYKPVTIIDEKKTAQIMFVMGTDATTPEHKEWKKNLTFALKLTEQLNANYNNFTRKMSLRESSYNQQYTQGSMLIEVGSCGNTLEEAKNAGILLAHQLSNIIKTGW